MTMDLFELLSNFTVEVLELFDPQPIDAKEMNTRSKLTLKQCVDLTEICIGYSMEMFQNYLIKSQLTLFRMGGGKFLNFFRTSNLVCSNLTDRINSLSVLKVRRTLQLSKKGLKTFLPLLEV